MLYDLDYSVSEGHLPKDFTKAVDMLERPYLPISKELYEDIKEATKKADTDFIICEGAKCTFGNADDGYAIMPLK